MGRISYASRSAATLALLVSDAVSNRPVWTVVAAAIHHGTHRRIVG